MPWIIMDWIEKWLKTNPQNFWWPVQCMPVDRESWTVSCADATLIEEIRTHNANEKLYLKLSSALQIVKMDFFDTSLPYSTLLSAN